MDVQGDDEMNVQNDGDYENPQVQDPATDTPQSISPAPVQTDQPSQVRYLRVLISTYEYITHTCIYRMNLSVSLLITFYVPIHTLCLSLSPSPTSHIPYIIPHYSNIYTECMVGKLQ